MASYINRALGSLLDLMVAAKREAETQGSSNSITEQTNATTSAAAASYIPDRARSYEIPCFYTETFAFDLHDRQKAECLGLNIDNCSHATYDFNVKATNKHTESHLIWEYVKTNADLSGARNFRVEEKLITSSDPYSHLKYGKRMMLDGKKNEGPETPKKTTKVIPDVGMYSVVFEETTYWILYQNVRTVSREKQTMVIFVNGRGQQKALQKFVEHVLNTAPPEKEAKKISVYKFNNSYWQLVTTKRARPIASVFLPRSVGETISKDLDTYLSQKTLLWYQRHGIPYKRIYLFHGSPGAGKTSYIQALAGEFSMKICYLQPTGPKFDDDMLQRALQMVPLNSIVVIEDIDALFSKNRNKEDRSSGLSFSGLLNGLDGVSNTKGQIFILTTNYLDRLDPTMIRSGRVDLRVEFPLAAKDQIEAMFHSFYPTLEPFGGCDDESVEEEDEDGNTVESNEKNEDSDSSGNRGKEHDGEDEKSATNASVTDSNTEDNDGTVLGVSSEEKAKLKNLATKFAREWMNRYPRGLSMATIQQHFIRHMHSNASECVKGVKNAEVWERPEGSHSDMFM